MSYSDLNEEQQEELGEAIANELGLNSDSGVEALLALADATQNHYRVRMADAVRRGYVDDVQNGSLEAQKYVDEWGLLLATLRV